MADNDPSPTLVTFVNFDGQDGSIPDPGLPYAGLITDAEGDLFGTAPVGDADFAGGVFEIVNTSGTYASTPANLASFDITDGYLPIGGLIADGEGNLFGTTEYGGDTNGDGTVYEIVNTSGGYASTPAVVAELNGSDGSNPTGALITDAAGDLIGTAFSGGTNGDGTVFEVVNDGGSFDATPVVLATFDGAGNGENPSGNLIEDAAGDLFGVTENGGADGDGTVFEIVKGDGTYASAPAVLVNFDGPNGATPIGGLIIDGKGDLFGTTQNGGADGEGTVFEIANSGGSYASAPTVLVSFDSNDGALPQAALIADAAGDLFGTTEAGGSNNDGTVFEVVNDASGYDSTPNVLVNFDGTDGEAPRGNLIADAEGDLFGPTSDGGSGGSGTAFEITDSGFVVSPAATLTTLAEFDGADGEYPFAHIIDATGNIIGVTDQGVTNSSASPGYGTLFEITNTAGSYASTPAVLVNFEVGDGTDPSSGLITDADGDLFGETESGSADGGGTVFELAKTTGGYASTPTVLASFSAGVSAGGRAPGGNLLMDSSGDLFGTTGPDGADGTGQVFEIAKTNGGYASTPTILANFTLAEGYNLLSLVADASGDLFGVAFGGGEGGSNGDGTVFEIAKTISGYANTPTVLVTFNGTDGSHPSGQLIVDSAGDLFGTTQQGGADDSGTVFEIAKTASLYASTPTILVSFNGTDGFVPTGSLLTDAKGDLFGTTEYGGTDNDGTAFEIANTESGYDSTPIVLANFDGSNGSQPIGGLTADADGDLFGQTLYGGTQGDDTLVNGDGTVFEITKSGFVVSTAPKLTTLVNFDGAGVDYPTANLITDASGNLIDTSAFGGADNGGTVFEVAKTASGYANAATVLFSFPRIEATDPDQLIVQDPLYVTADAKGNLLGTTAGGGASGDGTVFEIANISGSYASTPAVVTSLDGMNGLEPYSGVVADAEGDLFGTTRRGGASDNDGGQYGYGTVFEVAKTENGYASTATVVVSFNFTDGAYLSGSLITDSNGDLFGVTQGGGTNDNGTVFEIANTGGSYASAPTVLVSFNGDDGFDPDAGLIMDSDGDLFGTTSENDDTGAQEGTVFEIAKTDNGYADTPTVLASFDGTYGAMLQSSLLEDAAGDLFGVASQGGTNNDGTVFEIVKSGSTYASTPKVLFNFDGTNGASPAGKLITDADGDLFGTTEEGGANNDGTLFEITNSGFVTTPVCLARGTLLAAPGGEVAVEDLRPGDAVNTAAGIERVRWVGRRGYDGRFINGNHLALPVTIAAGALGEGVPVRDLVVSPGHGIWVEDVLVPAWRLVNGVSVTQAKSVAQIEYFNFELEGHGLLEAQGALVESFLDDGEFRNQFANVGEYWALYPDAPLCRDVIPLPRVESGFRLAAIQARVNFRAGLVEAKGKPGALRGFVDVPGIDGWVHGWAQDISWPETPVALRVYARGRYVARALANAYRADLRAAGVGSGCHAFFCRMPAAFAQDVEIRRETDGAVLPWTDAARRAAA